MWQVVLTRGNLRSIWGTYPSLAEAEHHADTHRARGYWESVEVQSIEALRLLSR